MSKKEKLVVEAPKPEAPKPEAPIVESVKPRLFVTVNNRLWHPDQSVYVGEVPVELEYDSWTECQHSAGLIKEVY